MGVEETQDPCTGSQPELPTGIRHSSGWCQAAHHSPKGYTACDSSALAEIKPSSTTDRMRAYWAGCFVSPPGFPISPISPLAMITPNSLKYQRGLRAIRAGTSSNRELFGQLVTP